MFSLPSFDPFPTVYLFTGYALAAIVGALAVRSGKGVSYGYLFGALGLFLFGRLPVIAFNRELNVDEAQMLTQAMTLVRDPVYWRSVDGTTGGPLGSYFLIVASWVTGNFSYITAHLAAFFLESLFFTLTYLAVKNWCGGKAAALVTYPALLFLTFTQYGDFVHYSSELVPVTLLSAIVFLFSAPGFLAKKHYASSVWLGILFVAMPFGKIQSIPLLAICGLYFLIQALRKKEYLHILAAGAGALGILALLALALWANGVLDDFLFYYINANFNYGDSGNWFDNLLKLPAQFIVGMDFLTVLIPIPVLLLFAISHPTRPSLRLLLFSAGLIGMGVLAISRTGTGYTHYLFFLLIPFVLFSASVSEVLRSGKSRAPLAITGLSLLSIILLTAVHYRQNKVLNLYASGPVENRTLPFSPVGKVLDGYKQPGDYLVVWGWNCQYYIETQLPQGVAENHTIRSAYSHPFRNQYRERYVGDMMQNKPALFIDVTGPNSYWMQDSVTQGYQRFPQLKAYVDRHYRHVKTVDHVRIFLRSDRADATR
ncbi:MAG: hypothetical protein J7576_00405 [Siphonobacter aquaeclarae]|nr:hypothetical protein [Siphonobacter aquaeclarae]